MNGKELLIGLSYVDRKYIEESECGALQTPVTVETLRKRKTWLIAAVIALALLLVGCAAVVYARIHMKVVQHNIPTAATTAVVPVEGVDSALYKDGKLWDVWSPQELLNPDYSIELEQEEDAYVGWEPIYPQWVPEGFEVSYVSGHAFGSQLIRYENDAGNFINHRLYYRLDDWGKQFEGMGQPEAVAINGNQGYHLGNRLIWTDETKGFGFVLSSDADVDLIEIAESVAVGPELKETHGDDTAKALEDLGDYQITALPEGMAEDSLSGAPYDSAEGVEWYSGVRRWYVNKETNDQVFFQYETYHESEVLTVEDMLFNYVAAWPLESFTIHGCPGAAGENVTNGATVAWVSGDETCGVRFRMMSKDFSTQELLAMAESVQKK